MKAFTALLLFATVATAQFEVIEVSNDLSPRTLELLWPVYRSGAISINDNEIIYPDQGFLTIQSRQNPLRTAKISLKHKGKDFFTAYQVAANARLLFYTVVGQDGRFYLFQRDRATEQIIHAQSRHGVSAERLFLINDSLSIATGAYRPELIGYLEKYNKDSIQEQRRNRKEKFDPLYLNHKAYSISVYDKKLKEVKRGNVINRIGDDARAYEGLYITHPVDTNSKNELYLIDNDQGYVVEKYVDFVDFNNSFEIQNPHFKKLPVKLTLEDMHEMWESESRYSVPYALYVKGDQMLTAFFQAPIRHGDVKPPYYYDLCTLSGEHLSSGELPYPFLCEDENEKLFLYVKKEGGWFEDDTHYLVGVTMADLISGKVEKSTVDLSIQKYEGE